MCQTCGCGGVGDIRIDGVKTPSGASRLSGLRVPSAVLYGHAQAHSHDHVQGHDHDHAHSHDPDHTHEHIVGETRTLSLNEAILAKNDRLAERNRGFFRAKGLSVLNILSSPGSGKTAFIERISKDRSNAVRLGVIVGDLETDNDAERLRAAGITAVQITTGDVCHLDAEMIAGAVDRLDLDGLDVLIIENVGNLVCPASYDLGEDSRVVILSVTEGEDKPLKYPLVFKTAQVVVVNKMDIAEVVEFDREKALSNIRRVAPQAEVFEVSARTGKGMDRWYAYLDRLVGAQRTG